MHRTRRSKAQKEQAAAALRIANQRRLQRSQSGYQALEPVTVKAAPPAIHAVNSNSLQDSVQTHPNAQRASRETRLERQARKDLHLQRELHNARRQKRRLERENERLLQECARIQEELEASARKLRELHARWALLLQAAGEQERARYAYCWHTAYYPQQAHGSIVMVPRWGRGAFYYPE